METVQISKWMLYGPYIFIGIFIIILTIITIYSMRKNKEFMKSLFDSQQSQINMIKDALTNISNTTKEQLSTVSKINSEQEQHHYHATVEEMLSVFDRIYSSIKDDLYVTMTSLKACRIALYLFHNGTKSVNGINFVKVSCVGEKILIGSGIKEQIAAQSNIPVNIFDDIYDNLIVNGKFIIIKDDNNIQSARVQFLSAPKITYSQGVCVYDTNNNALGFLLVEFDHPYNKLVCDKEYLEIKEMTNKFSPMLSFTNYANLTLKNNMEGLK